MNTIWVAEHIVSPRICHCFPIPKLSDFKDILTNALWAWTILGGNLALAPYIDKQKWRRGMIQLSSSGTDQLLQQDNVYLWQVGAAWVKQDISVYVCMDSDIWRMSCS